MVEQVCENCTHFKPESVMPEDTESATPGELLDGVIMLAMIYSLNDLAVEVGLISADEMAVFGRCLVGGITLWSIEECRYEGKSLFVEK